MRHRRPLLIIYSLVGTNLTIVQWVLVVLYIMMLQRLLWTYGVLKMRKEWWLPILQVMGLKYMNGVFFYDTDNKCLLIVHIKHKAYFGLN